MLGQSADRKGQHKQQSEKVMERNRWKKKVMRAVHGKERGGVLGQAADGDGHQNKQQVGNDGGQAERHGTSNGWEEEGQNRTRGGQEGEKGARH